MGLDIPICPSHPRCLLNGSYSFGELKRSGKEGTASWVLVFASTPTCCATEGALPTLGQRPFQLKTLQDPRPPQFHQADFPGLTSLQ